MQSIGVVYLGSVILSTVRPHPLVRGNTQPTVVPSYAIQLGMIIEAIVIPEA